MKKHKIQLGLFVLIVGFLALFTACTNPNVYVINLPTDVIGGSVTSNAFRVEEGENLVLSIQSDEGYTLDYLKIGDLDVSNDIENNQYTISDIKSDLDVLVNFKLIAYSINYELNGGDNPLDEITNYTVKDSILLPEPTKVNHTFDGWYDNNTYTGKPVTNIVKGTTGDKTYYAKWIERYSYIISGQVSSSNYLFNTVNYSVHAFDFANVEITFDGPEIKKVNLAEDGSYSVTLLPGEYSVVFECENFASYETTINLDNNQILNVEMDTPLLGGSVDNGTWKVQSEDALWTTSDDLKSISSSKVAQIYFSGQYSNKYLIETKISDIKTINDKKAGIIIAAYNDGSNLIRYGIMLDDKNDDLVLWQTTGAAQKWSNHLKMPMDLVLNTLKLTVVRDGENCYVFLDDVFISKMVIPYTEEAAFGFQTIGCGATYSNYLYSYNTSLIDAMIGAAVNLTEFENGNVTVNKMEDVKLGDEIQITINANDGYLLNSFKINNVDLLADLVLSDNTYTYTYLVTSKAVDIECTFASKNTFSVGYDSFEGGSVTVLHNQNPLNSGDLVYEGDQISIEVTTLEGYVIKNLTINVDGNVVSINPGEVVTVNGNIVISVELDTSINVMGTISSAQYTYQDTLYDLYQINYNEIKVLYTDKNSLINHEATVNPDGSYTINVPVGTYGVKYEYPNFIATEQEVVVEISGVTTATLNNKDLKLDNPLLGGSVVVGSSSVGGGNDEAFWTYGNHTATASKVAQVYFSGQVGTRYIVETRISNLLPTNPTTDKDKKASIIIAGYNNGSLQRQAIFLDQDNNLVRLWKSGSWDGTYQSTNNSLDLKSELGNKLTVVRDGENCYVFLDDVFISKMVIPYTEEAAFGFQTLGCGATYSNYLYSYNTSLIDAMIASTIG